MQSSNHAERLPIGLADWLRRPSVPLGLVGYPPIAEGPELERLLARLGRPDDSAPDARLRR